VTKAQLEELGLQSLLGTNNARAYMHGYFIDMKIYMEAKNHTHLNAVEAYREKKVALKIKTLAYFNLGQILTLYFKCD
jgi:hypothetical protein